MPNRIFVDNVCCLITNNETSRNCSISAPVLLTSRAKLLSQMNPIAGSMSADSRSVEIQASLMFDQPVPIMAGRVPLGFRLAMNKPVNPIEFDAPSVPLYAPRKAVYPQSVSGTFRNLKWALMALCLAVYYLLPFVRWDRGPNAPSQAVLV